MGTLRILLDLSFASLGGYSGIPYDTRTIFKMLADREGMEVEGLLVDRRGLGRFLTKPRDMAPLSVILATGSVIGAAVDAQQGRRKRAKLFGLNMITKTLRHAGVMLGRSHWRAEVPRGQLEDTIWRVYFARSLPPDARAQIVSTRYHLTNLDWPRMVRGSSLPWQKWPVLDTRGFEFLLTSDLRLVEVSPGTLHINRFHDAVPLLHPDTTTTAREQYRLLRRLHPRSVVVCNSQATLDDLRRLLPAVTPRSCAIHCAVPSVNLAAARSTDPITIIRRRFSAVSLAPEQVRPARRRFEGKHQVRYILNVGTIEPRKNIRGLLEAWQIARQLAGFDLHLLHIGSPGWLFNDSLSAMRPYVAEGDLIHLENLTQSEVDALYAHAAAVVSPSFAEGFGFAVAQALPHGIPIVASNLAAHREVAGDAAHYADPYDPAAFAEQILRVCGPDADQSQVAARAAKGRAMAERLEPQNIGAQWQDLLVRLRDRGPEGAAT